MYRHYNLRCTLCGEAYVGQHVKRLGCYRCIPDGKAKHRFFVYGITQPQYDAILERQNFKCGICQRPLINIPSRKIHVDHDHVTGQVRGVICLRCNLGLSFLDVEGWLESALTYVSGSLSTQQKL